MATNGFDKRPQDINRKGRPKKGETLTDILKAFGELPDVDFGGAKIERNKALAQKLWQKALEGDFNSIKYIYDRIDGTAIQKMIMQNDKDAEWLELMKGVVNDVDSETEEDN